jgi:pectate lyase
MGKRKILSLMMAVVLIVGAVFIGSSVAVKADSSVSWNMSDTQFRNLGTISSTLTINNLKLIANSSSNMSVIKSTQSLNGTNYDYCLALGGSGSMTYRAIAVSVSGTSTVKITAKSSGTSTRTLAVVNDSGTEVGTIACSSTLSTGSVTINGTGTLYFFSKNSGINIYKVQVDSTSSTDSTGSTSGSTSGSTTGATSTAINGDGYPDQLMQFVSTSDGKYLTASSTAANANIISSQTSSTSNKWKIVKKGSDYYQIVNEASGYVLAPSGNNVSSGNKVVVTSNSGNTASYWKVVSVKTDCNSDALNYKVVNYNNTNLALTLSGTSYVLNTYSGSSTQCFRFNAYGAEGFAGYCKNMSNKEKASITGGVLGDVVYVTSISELQNYASGSTPYTIVIKGNLSASSITKVTVGKNKTFVGSFSNHTLNNVHFRAISSSGNVIFKNITFSHSGNLNANDDIQVYISNGNNFWLDHCTWTGHSSLTSSDVDKHLYVGLKADYITVTGCKFMNHEYGLILGYPEDDGLGTYSGYPQMTIANNYFTGVLTRAPGLMRYGYFHCYNNYVYDFNLGYTPYTGVNIYSEKNCFEKGSHTGAVVDDHGVGAFTDSGSILSYSITNLKTGPSSFRPINNYGYATRSASDAKTWCLNCCGSQSSKLTYAID